MKLNTTTCALLIAGITVLSVNADDKDSPRKGPGAKPGERGKDSDRRQGRPGRGDRTEALIKALGLNKEQTAKFKKISEEQRAAMQKLLAAARNGDIKREEIRAKSTKMREENQKKLSAILTEEQRKKLAEMQKRRPQRPGGGKGRPERPPRKKGTDANFNGQTFVINDDDRRRGDDDDRGKRRAEAIERYNKYRAERMKKVIEERRKKAEAERNHERREHSRSHKSREAAEARRKEHDRDHHGRGHDRDGDRGHDHGKRNHHGRGHDRDDRSDHAERMKKYQQLREAFAARIKQSIEARKRAAQQHSSRGHHGRPTWQSRGSHGHSRGGPAKPGHGAKSSHGKCPNCGKGHSSRGPQRGPQGHSARGPQRGGPRPPYGHGARSPQRGGPRLPHSPPSHGRGGPRGGRR